VRLRDRMGQHDVDASSSRGVSRLRASNIFLKTTHLVDQKTAPLLVQLAAATTTLVPVVVFSVVMQKMVVVAALQHLQVRGDCIA
jgi:hypothetical protein